MPYSKPEVHNVSQRTPKEDRAMTIGNMHKNLVKTVRVVSEICSRRDRQTDRKRRHTHTHTILITILRNRSRGRSKNYIYHQTRKGKHIYIDKITVCPRIAHFLSCVCIVQWIVFPAVFVVLCLLMVNEDYCHYERILSSSDEDGTAISSGVMLSGDEYNWCVCDDCLPVSLVRMSVEHCAARRSSTPETWPKRTPRTPSSVCCTGDTHHSTAWRLGCLMTTTDGSTNDRTRVLERSTELRFYVTFRHKIGHFGDVLSNRSLSLEKLNLTQQKKHASVTKYTITQNKQKISQVWSSLTTSGLETELVYSSGSK